MLHPKILISIQTEFGDNEDGKEMEKQDSETKACWCLMEKLKKAFARLQSDCVQMACTPVKVSLKDAGGQIGIISCDIRKGVFQLSE